MLLAINVGNTHTSAGIWDGSGWAARAKRVTDPDESAGHIAAWLSETFGGGSVERAWAASVVPWLNARWSDAVSSAFGASVRLLEGTMDLALTIQYSHPESLGADRLANVLGALRLAPPPVITVDFGTATSIEVADATGAFVGGAILPGAGLAAEALARGTAQLRKPALQMPERVIGGDTESCLQSGVVAGHACAVDGLLNRMFGELGLEAQVFATGGLACLFVGICRTPMQHEPDLTLLGLVEADDRLC